MEPRSKYVGIVCDREMPGVLVLYRGADKAMAEANTRGAACGLPWRVFEITPDIERVDAELTEWMKSVGVRQDKISFLIFTIFKILSELLQAKDGEPSRVPQFSRN
jgi:hypothetical protein